MMTMFCRTFPLVCLIFAGCSQDPTEQFKSFVSKATEKTKEIKISPNTSERDITVKIDYSQTEVSFDVEKTNSTISPYTATVTLKYEDTEFYVSAENKKGYIIWQNIDHFNYAYQDNKWILKTFDGSISPISEMYDGEKRDKSSIYLSKKNPEKVLVDCFTP